MTEAARKVASGAAFGLLLGLAVIVSVIVVFGPIAALLLYANSHFPFWWGIGLGVGGTVIWASVTGGVVANFLPSSNLFMPSPPPPPDFFLYAHEAHPKTESPAAAQPQGRAE